MFFSVNKFVLYLVIVQPGQGFLASTTVGNSIHLNRHSVRVEVGVGEFLRPDCRLYEMTRGEGKG